MTQTASLDAPAGSPLHRIAWHCRHNPKRELWLAWWTLVVFYNFFFLVFFVITRVQPPPSSGWDAPRVVQWLHHNHFGLLAGFAIMFVITGMTTMCSALTVGALRPASDPALITWIYDFAFLSFVGTMGVFLIGSLLWMLAILIDKNRVFPKWFGYLNFCDALTEIVV
jgi:hypothetical protein